MSENEMFLMFGALGLMFVALMLMFGAITFLWVELRSMQKSTHSIQYVDPFKDLKGNNGLDVDPPADFEKMSPETKEKLQKDYFGNIT